MELVKTFPDTTKMFATAWFRCSDHWLQAVWEPHRESVQLYKWQHVFKNRRWEGFGTLPWQNGYDISKQVPYKEPYTEANWKAFIEQLPAIMLEEIL